MRISKKSNFKLDTSLDLDTQQNHPPSLKYINIAIELRSDISVTDCIVWATSRKVFLGVCVLHEKVLMLSYQQDTANNPCRKIHRA